MATTIPRIAVTGIIGAAWLSGNIASLSLISVPALTTPQARDSVPPTILAREWNTIYRTGRAQNPPIALASAAPFLYLAWTLRSLPGNKATLFGAAAVLTVGIVPWTLLAMQPTINKLVKQSESEKDGKGVLEQQVQDLVRKWGDLNLVRSLFPLVGGALAAFAALA